MRQKNEWLLRAETPQILKYVWFLFLSVLVLSQPTSLQHSPKQHIK